MSRKTDSNERNEQSPFAFSQSASLKGVVNCANGEVNCNHTGDQVTILAEDDEDGCKPLLGLSGQVEQSEFQALPNVLKLNDDIKVSQVVSKIYDDVLDSSSIGFREFVEPSPAQNGVPVAIEESSTENVLTDDEERNMTINLEKAFARLNDSVRNNGMARAVQPPAGRRLIYDISTSSSSSSNLVCMSYATPSAYRRRVSYAITSQKNFKKPAKRPHSKKVILFALSMVNLTAYLSMSILAPFFPYEASLKGMTSSSTGLVFSIYALVIMVSSPLLGKALPIVGVKFMLLAGILFAGVANILFGVLYLVPDLWTFTILCYLVRSVSAFGEAAFMTASYTYIIQLFPDNIGLAFGITETCVGVGMSIGPAVGGLLYGVGGYGLPFYVLGAFVLINLPICWYIVNPIESNLLTNQSSSSSYSYESPVTYGKIISNAKVLIVSLVLATVTSTQSYLDPTVEPHFRSYGLTPQYVGLIFLVMSGAYALSSPMIGWLTSKTDKTLLIMFVGLVGTATGYLLLGPSEFLQLEPNLWLSTAAMVVLGLSYSLAFIPTFEAILDSVIDNGGPDDLNTYSLVSGWWSSLTSLGEVVGATVGGVFLDTYGFNEGTDIVAFWVGAVAVVVGLSYLLDCLIDFTTKPKAKIFVDDFSDQRPLFGRGHHHNHGGHRCARCERAPLMGNLVAYRPARQRRSILQTI